MGRSVFKRPMKYSKKHSNKRSKKRSMKRSMKRPMKRSMKSSMKRSMKRSNKLSMKRSNKLSMKRSNKLSKNRYKKTLKKRQTMKIKYGGASDKANAEVTDENLPLFGPDKKVHSEIKERIRAARNKAEAAVNEEEQQPDNLERAPTTEWKWKKQSKETSAPPTVSLTKLPDMAGSVVREWDKPPGPPDATSSIDDSNKRVETEYFGKSLKDRMAAFGEKPETQQTKSTTMSPKEKAQFMKEMGKDIREAKEYFDKGDYELAAQKYNELVRSVKNSSVRPEIKELKVKEFTELAAAAERAAATPATDAGKTLKQRMETTQEKWVADTPHRPEGILPEEQMEVVLEADATETREVDQGLLASPTDARGVVRSSVDSSASSASVDSSGSTIAPVDLQRSIDNTVVTLAHKNYTTQYYRLSVDQAPPPEVEVMEIVMSYNEIYARSRQILEDVAKYAKKKLIDKTVDAVLVEKGSLPEPQIARYKSYLEKSPMKTVVASALHYKVNMENIKQLQGLINTFNEIFAVGTDNKSHYWSKNHTFPNKDKRVEKITNLLRLIFHDVECAGDSRSLATAQKWKAFNQEIKAQVRLIFLQAFFDAESTYQPGTALARSSSSPSLSDDVPGGARDSTETDEDLFAGLAVTSTESSPSSPSLPAARAPSPAARAPSLPAVSAAPVGERDSTEHDEDEDLFAGLAVTSTTRSSASSSMSDAVPVGARDSTEPDEDEDPFAGFANTSTARSSASSSMSDAVPVGARDSTEHDEDEDPFAGFANTSTARSSASSSMSDAVPVGARDSTEPDEDEDPFAGFANTSTARSSASSSMSDAVPVNATVAPSTGAHVTRADLESPQPAVEATGTLVEDATDTTSKKLDVPSAEDLEKMTNDQIYDLPEDMFDYMDVDKLAIIQAKQAEFLIEEGDYDGALEELLLAESFDENNKKVKQLLAMPELSARLSK